MTLNYKSHKSFWLSGFSYHFMLKMLFLQYKSISILIFYHLNSFNVKMIWSLPDTKRQILRQCVLHRLHEALNLIVSALPFSHNCICTFGDNRSTTCCIAVGRSAVSAGVTQSESDDYLSSLGANHTLTVCRCSSDWHWLGVNVNPLRPSIFHFTQCKI